MLVARLRHLQEPGAIADGLLERFSFTDAGARKVATCSGGMRRRLDIAMSLIGDPTVHLLDEPTTGLDPQGRIDVWQAVKELARQGTTVRPFRAPQANAHAERFVRTARTDCLDWLLVLGPRHLERVLRVYVGHYNTEHPHRVLVAAVARRERTRPTLRPAKAVAGQARKLVRSEHVEARRREERRVSRIQRRLRRNELRREEVEVVPPVVEVRGGGPVMVS